MLCSCSEQKIASFHSNPNKQRCCTRNMGTLRLYAWVVGVWRCLCSCHIDKVCPFFITFNNIINMETIFNIVANVLFSIAQNTGLSYNEINIIIYYVIIPFSFAVLIDIYFSKHAAKIFFFALMLIAGFIIQDFSKFSDWLFSISVNFLNIFSFIGINYITSSVIICVFLVIMIYIFLITAIVKKRNKLKNLTN